jgi:hypothetical protein
VVAYGQQYFFSVEAQSAFVPPRPGSYANRVGLYNDELVAAPNPRLGEEAGVEAVLDAAVERRLGLDATEIGGHCFQNRSMRGGGAGLGADGALLCEGALGAGRLDGVGGGLLM